MHQCPEGDSHSVPTIHNRQRSEVQTWTSRFLTYMEEKVHTHYHKHALTHMYTHMHMHTPGVLHSHDGGNEEGLVSHLRHNNDRDGGQKSMEEPIILRFVQLFYVF